MSKFNDLTDDALIDQLAKLRGEGTGEVADCLLCINEVRSRMLHTARGYRSIYKFLSAEFKFSKNQSYGRIRAAEALAIVPEIETALRDGSTCFTYFASAMVAIYREGKRLRSVGQPSVQMIERRSFLREILETADVELAIAHHFPELIGETDFEKTLANEQVQYSLTASASEALLIERAKELLAHKFRDGRWHDVALELVLFFLQRRDPLLREGRVALQESTSKQRGHIALAIRQALLIRSGSRCEFVGSERRCDARSPLEIDHILPVAHGGTDSFENLRLLCSEHNRFEAFRKTRGFSRQRENTDVRV